MNQAHPSGSTGSDLDWKRDGMVGGGSGRDWCGEERSPVWKQSYPADLSWTRRATGIDSERMWKRAHVEAK